MRNSIPQSQSRENENAAGARWIGDTMVALLPVLACLLGGATEKAGEGIVVTFLGLYLLARPPRFSLGALTNTVLLAFFVLAAIAFLPAIWFFQAPWRAALVNDFGIELPSTLTPQPWITASCLISFVAGLSWLYAVCTQDLELREARSQLRLFTGGMVLLAVLSIALHVAHTALPFWHNERNFGPFPNRNQTGDLFGLTAIMILACGQDDLRKGRTRWVLWVLAFALVVAAIILNFSRAGIGILVTGSAFWIGALAFRQRAPSRIALGASALLLLLTVLLLFGGQTLERFHLRDFGAIGISTDFRWRIFQDTFQLIRNSPWCGIGLGNFESIFALFREASISDRRALHPESDWLWLWTELGWPAVVLTFAGIVVIIRRVFPLQEGTNQRYRLATLIAALLFAVHGIIDVSGHRVGSAFAGVFLLGLSLHQPLCLKRSQWVSILFRLVGLMLFVAGASWVGAARGEKLLPGSIGVSNAKELTTITNRERNFTETIVLATRALKWAPLDWQLYFSRAQAEVQAKEPAKALEDFRRSRFLEPIAYEVPLAEGSSWLLSNPILAATAWREALRRAGPVRPGVYASMLSSASLRSPAVSKILEEVGLSEHDLALPYLNRISGAPFNRALAGLLRIDPNLQSFTETEKLALFALWSERGDPEELSRAVQTHPDWLRYAWLGMAKYNAGRNDFRAAYELTRQFGEPVALPRITTSSSLEDLEKRFHATPDNFGLGYELYRAQMQSGRIDDALFTVRHFGERPNAPAYFHFLEAQCWAAKQNWERAWNAWQAFRSARTQAAR
jgi:O-antigen ligase/tetratricopeptide (TPR) repeat protein